MTKPAVLRCAVHVESFPAHLEAPAHKGYMMRAPEGLLAIERHRHAPRNLWKITPRLKLAHFSNRGLKPLTVDIHIHPFWQK